MRSEITQRIIDETPERVKDEVKEYAKNRIRMNDKERKIHVLEMVLELCWPRLLPEELADLRSLMEDLKGEHNDSFAIEFADYMEHRKYRYDHQEQKTHTPEEHLHHFKQTDL